MDFVDVIDMLNRAGYTVIPPEDEGTIHYQIVMNYEDRQSMVIGCTYNRLSVLSEEPDATFVPMSKDDCEVCNEC